jgi:NCAIR mutase (PurE)-related protein
VGRDKLLELLHQVQNGQVSPQAAYQKLRDLPYEDLGFAKIDHHRALRSGFAEVIYCPNKTTEQIREIAKRLAQRSDNILATRAEPEAFVAVKQAIPEAEYHEISRAITVWRDRQLYGRGTILVVSAGTADMAVAEEAALTAEIMGNRVDRIYDVGVAGIHRLLDQRSRLAAAEVIVVVAGMEGALASVVGGLVQVPIIAVPTSVGYGANFQGLSALLGMLTSCAAGVTVVNIDNGFGAGYAASLINRRKEG